MFRKLMKYDFKALIKYWWIAALTSVFLSAAGVFLIHILKMEGLENTPYEFIQILAGFGLFFIAVGLVIFVELAAILSYIRFYKHFFSDEGYLTFTLPVKKTDLLNSKLVSALLLTSASVVIILVEIIVVLLLGIPEKILAPEFLQELMNVINVIFAEGGVFNFIIIIELIVMFLFVLALSMLFTFACITVASVIVRKHKVLAAVGIYYAASGIVSTVMQMTMYTDGFFKVLSIIEGMEVLQMYTTITVILLAVICLLGVLLFGLYLFEVYLLERKLNLD